MTSMCNFQDHMFLVSLGWQLVEWGFLKREMEIDDEFPQFKLGDSDVP